MSTDGEKIILDDFSTICRTCLMKYDSDDLLCLDELYIDDGEIRLIDILGKYTEIEENECLPQKICGDCILKTEAAYCFFVKVNESNLILNQFSHINGTEEISSSCNESETEMDVTLGQEDDLEIIKVIKDDDQENLEIKIILDKAELKEEVEDNAYFYSSDEKFTIDHVASLNTTSYSPVEKCKFCKMEVDVEDMEEHRREFGHFDNSEIIKCPHCDISTRNITNLRQHLRSYHSNRREAKKYVCEFCFKEFKWTKNYEEHLKTHNANQEEKVMCPQCGMLLANVTALQIHKSKEHISALNMVWTCHHCNMICGKISEFKKHLRDIHNEKDFHCIICGKDYEDKTTLYYHQQLHLEEYGIECNICHRKLLTEEKLILHQRIHKYVKKKHICSFCNKGFKQLDKLEAHERIHTGEKPFICNECGKAFNHQNNLNHHSRLHSGKTPYKCLFCSKGFSNSHSLRKHMRDQHNVFN